MADDVAIHKIDDLDIFYQALGYTREMQRAGIEKEFYRWSEFTKDHAIESPACLQNKIIEYLKIHSKLFLEKFASEYESWAGSCAPENLRDTADCKACRMYPGNEPSSNG